MINLFFSFFLIYVSASASMNPVYKMEVIFPDPLSCNSLPYPNLISHRYQISAKALQASCGAAAFTNVWSQFRLWLIARAFSIAFLKEGNSLHMRTKLKHIPTKSRKYRQYFCSTKHENCLCNPFPTNIACYINLLSINFLRISSSLNICSCSHSFSIVFELTNAIILFISSFSLNISANCSMSFLLILR